MLRYSSKKSKLDKLIAPALRAVPAARFREPSFMSRIKESNTRLRIFSMPEISGFPSACAEENQGAS